MFQFISIATFIVPSTYVTKYQIYNDCSPEVFKVDTCAINLKFLKIAIAKLALMSWMLQKNPKWNFIMLIGMTQSRNITEALMAF